MTFSPSILRALPRILLAFCLGCVGILASAADDSQPVWRSKSVAQWADVLKQKDSAARTPSIREQWYAAYALGQYGPDAVSAVPVMLERLERDAGKDDDVRACILYSLGLIGAPETFPAVLEAFGSPYPIIQRTAAGVLARFPEQIAKNPEIIRSMNAILEERAETQFPLAANCAVTLWAIGQKETVSTWLSASLNSDRKNDFTRNFEIYQALSVFHQIMAAAFSDSSPSSADVFSAEESSDFARRLTVLVEESSDLDVVLSACEALVSLGSFSVEPVREAFGKSANPRLLFILAQTDSDSEETRALLLKALADAGNEIPLRTAAARGLQFLPAAGRAEAVSVLVALINDEATPASLSDEARFLLKKLQPTTSESN